MGQTSDSIRPWSVSSDGYLFGRIWIIYLRMCVARRKSGDASARTSERAYLHRAPSTTASLMPAHALPSPTTAVAYQQNGLRRCTGRGTTCPMQTAFCTPTAVPDAWLPITTGWRGHPPSSSPRYGGDREQRRILGQATLARTYHPRAEQAQARTRRRQLATRHGGGLSSKVPARTPRRTGLCPSPSCCATAALAAGASPTPTATPLPPRLLPGWWVWRWW